MLKKAVNYRLDWRGEFQKLEPFIAGKGGAIALSYNSEDSAAGKFNHILKESFAAGNPNAPRLSLRVDKDFGGTRYTGGIVGEIGRLLSDGGFLDPADLETGLNLFSNNSAGGNMEMNLDTVVINGAMSDANIDRLPDAIVAAIEKFVAAGGRFLLQLNDMALSEQTRFWRLFWDGGLSAAFGDALVLVVCAGPEAQGRFAEECPGFDARLQLPCSVDKDSKRDEHFYDDLHDIFAQAGCGEPGDLAVSHMTSNRQSVLQVHANLTGTLEELRTRAGGDGV